MSAAIKPKGPRQTPAQYHPLAWATTYLNSTVGSKVLVAITGLSLVGFLVFHMIGNLKVLFGQDDINGYAHFLKHGLGPILWIARGGLLVLFVTHIALALRLKAKTSAARPVPYLALKPVQATLSSRTMLLTGLVVGAFLLYHLAHFTFGWTHQVELANGMKVDYQSLKDAEGRPDVYSITVAGFRSPLIAGLYIVAQLILFAHLSHGIQSTLQTLGLKGTRFAPLWSALGFSTAGAILIGNLVIVIAILSGLVPPIYPGAR